MKQESFNLIEYLRSDLTRARQLADAQDKTFEWRSFFWIGIFSPRFIPIFVYRLSFFFQCWHLIPLAKVLSFVNFFLFGLEISLKTSIGKGLYLPHTQGTVIGALTIGENVTIYQGATLGAKELDIKLDPDARPVVGSNVIIGSGAKILGSVKVGDGSKVGANAVVLSDVPANHVALGVPAKVNPLK